MSRLAPILCALAVAGCYPDLSGYRVEATGPGDAGERGDCSAVLRAETVTRSQSSCFLDETVSGAVGTLYYHCGAVAEDGAASLELGGRRFVGTIRGDDIEVEHESTYNNMGRCDWVTTQRVTGSLLDPSLSYRYSERPASGETGCATPCTGLADLEIRP